MRQRKDEAWSKQSLHGDPSFIPGESIFREHILDHYHSPRNFGTLQEKTLSLRARNPLCGDELTFHLLVERSRITKIRFEGKGCAISTAAASLLTEAVKGKTLREVASMSSDDHLKRLHIPLGPVRMKCALLSFYLLKDAVRAHRGGTR